MTLHLLIISHVSCSGCDWRIKRLPLSSLTYRTLWMEQRRREINFSFWPVRLSPETLPSLFFYLLLGFPSRVTQSVFCGSPLKGKGPLLSRHSNGFFQRSERSSAIHTCFSNQAPVLSAATKPCFRYTFVQTMKRYP